MILLISCSESGRECRNALQNGTGERVHLVETFSQAGTVLKERKYSVMVIDYEMARADPEGHSFVVHANPAAFPVYVKLGASSPERVVSEVRSSLRRRHSEHAAAIRIAMSELRGELRTAVTGILLSSELAMSVPELPRSAHVKIKFVHDLAQGIQRQLEA